MPSMTRPSQGVTTASRFDGAWSGRLLCAARYPDGDAWGVAAAGVSAGARALAPAWRAARPVCGALPDRRGCPDPRCPGAHPAGAAVVPQLGDLAAAGRLGRP